MSRAVVFYRTADGHCPIEQFLDTLPAKVAQKVLWVLKLIKEVDIVPGQYFKKLSGTDELWECRIVHGGNTYRLFGFFEKGSIVVFTHGIMKRHRKHRYQKFIELRN